MGRLVACVLLATLAGGCGQEDPDTLRAQAEALREQVRRVGDLASPDVVARREAAKELGRRRNLDGVAVAALASVLADRDRWVREAAAIALREQGPGALPALAQLIEALQDEDEAVRWRAAEALGRIGPAAAAAREALARHATDPHEVEVVKAASQVALERIGARQDGEPSPPGR